MRHQETTTVIKEKVEALVQLWNAQPVVYTDDNVFDVEDDDEDDGL